MENGQEIYVVRHLPINNGELMEDEDPSTEFPYRRWLRRKRFIREIKKGKLVDLSVEPARPRWGG